ncbi:hypothetical protein B0H66DRAFT_576669 [Apodospora peruviana]|uniref:Aminoglycoside phosphotransferase domain-containing protein n=1 Tax=Apodospora peruviana TaxID=516989 RepID=A0AAE0I2A3_9PEZI|nr:hypothetical protein B0H66DRAFT_576669 [Apodospora peruviana]
MPAPNQDGLRWKETAFNPVPEWTRDPSITAIEKICRQRLSIPPDEICEVDFHASGLFNQLYTIRRANNASLIMRVTLPVFPRHKTRAEVATLRTDNEIGFEWGLMELMRGAPTHTRWWDMSMGQKVAFTKQIAKFQAELSNPDFLFRGHRDFFMGDHLGYDVPQGPFHSSRDWLSTKLEIILQHQIAVLKNSEDEDEREDAEDILAAGQKLLAIVSKVFFPSTSIQEQRPETTALYHHDLHLNNILVGETGEITAVLDWECVLAMPLWMATKLPKFLEGPVREEEPLMDAYADTKHGRKNELYFIHRMEYEATELRKVYNARLKELWPEWPVEDMEKNAEIMDLFEAIELWADCVLGGEIVRFDITNP